MSRFSGFTRVGDALTKSPKATAVGLSLALTSLFGWGLDRGLSSTTPVEAVIAKPSDWDVTPTAKAVSEATALRLFDDLAANNRIPFGDLQDCFTRAEIMRRLLEQHGLRVSKVWAFKNGDDRLEYFSPRAMIPVNWDFHVAVALPVVDEDGHKKNYVFDPSLFNAPVEIDQWATRIHAHRDKVHLAPPDALPDGFRQLYRYKYGTQDFDHLTSEDLARPHLEHRKVYGALLREQLCIEKGDSEACKMEGPTWNTAWRPHYRSPVVRQIFKFL